MWSFVCRVICVWSLCVELYVCGVMRVIIEDRFSRFKCICSVSTVTV